MEYTILLSALVLFAALYRTESAPSRRSRAISTPETVSERESKLEDVFKEGTTSAPEPTNRRNKALNLFGGYFPSYLSSGLDYMEDDDDDVTFSVNDDHLDDDDISRTIPSKRRQQNKKKNGSGNTFPNDNLNSLQYDNSPIFYIRLPPTPYMFVPGLGYVSQPPTLGPAMPPMMPQVPQQVSDPFINLPIDFVSNGKPTGVYQWSGSSGFPPAPQMSVDPFGYGPSQPMPPVHRPSYSSPSYSKPKPQSVSSNSKITNLKGPYVFNGKPGDSVYVLRDTYNSIYSDALQNFYP
ncbi:pollen-specific leucine-rich repeat extensin-like protein 3 [Melitaea cinxia]|uniref:pollen-specific leucine-rich repeat extensin-like protein 3 n=1 Tax=Melitaea cinxia TaxID=113334 RepID=UPI001E27013A|nr:pollen-specific leucine-rich repeat extensin-like protein 3 [Melitaea cinxia]